MTLDLPAQSDAIAGEIDRVVDVDEIGELTARAYELTLGEFEAMNAKQRETILFALLREQAATIRSLDMRVDLYEAKFKELATPEGMQELTNKFLGGMGGGGMGNLLKGMLR
jgi:hypothetical protein